MAISEKDLDFTVWAIMDVSPEKAFEAVADPDQISQYFVMGGAKGRMERGASVTWEFADFPGPFDVQVVEAESPKRLAFDWPHVSGKGMNRVTFTFEEIESDRCKVSITEGGWSADAEGVQQGYGNCMGWSQMLAAMKAWVDYGIKIRPGMYR